jgi:hypothetical protein
MSKYFTGSFCNTHQCFFLKNFVFSQIGNHPLEGVENVAIKYKNLVIFTIIFPHFW